MSRYVIELRDRRARDPLRCGGKAANLARLSARGIPVPEGFVVTTALFEELGVGGAPERLRAALLTSPLPGGARAQIRAALSSLGLPVAVRSSMVGEDGQEHSYAGILESYLDISADGEAIDAVRRCMASVLDRRALIYRREIGGAGGGSRAVPPVAVLVQRMVRAEAGGVAFTVDPATGKRSVVIEATPGGAAGVASGTVIPQRYVCDGDRTTRYTADGDAPVLPPEAVDALRGLLLRVESVLGRRQDVEWALEKGRFLILQSRPITAVGGAAVYSNRMVSDMVPGIVQPLLWSTNVLDMTENVFRPVFTALLGRVEMPWRSLVGRFHSRVYENATAFGALLARLGMPEDFFERIALRSPERPRRPAAGRLVRRLPRLVRFALRHTRIRAHVDAFCRRHDRELEPFRGSDPGSLDLPALIDRARELRRMHGGTQWYMWIGAMNMAVRNRLLRRYAGRRAAGIDPNDLVRGTEGLRSLEPDAGMRAIAAALPAGEDDLRSCLERGDDAEVRVRLSRIPEGARVLEAFDAFMERYGFLGTNGVDFTLPPWRETPGVIWKNIARIADGGGPAGSGAPPEAARAGGDAVASVRARLGPAGRLLFGRLLESTRAYLRIRERMSFFMSEDAWQMRRTYLALGRILAGGGVIDRADDVFRLEWDELEMLAAGRLASGEAKALIERRGREMAADAAIEPDEVIFTVGGRAVPAPPETAPDDILEGIPGSGGTATGRAMIVRDPAGVARRLTRDDIIVVPSTDAGWSTIFSAAGGVVAESGGQLSHSAIIAREYGIPAVVGLRRATRLIRDGQELTVDGFRGRVYLAGNARRQE